MNILSQILNLGGKNLLINESLYKFKEVLNEFFYIFSSTSDDSFINYVNMTLQLQELINNFCQKLIIDTFEKIDKQFCGSIERKKEYYINKKNISRTIITIFGEITFHRTLYKNKITGEYYFYLDEKLGLEAYKNYDPIIRGILVDDSVNTCPNTASNHSSLNALSLKKYVNGNRKIPRQTIYYFKKNTKIRTIKYDLIPDNKTLYVMVDEKFIHKQDKKESKKKKYIMSKCFVIFTGIKRKGKRSRLIGKHTFITSSDKPWKELMKEIYKIYDFEHITTINLLSDAGSWILSGKDELKLYSNNKIIVNTCEFHVKQKINRSTTDKELREKIVNIIYENEDKNYILKHWKGIINMKNSPCKSSMEAHIEQCIASSFSSVPKAYSSENIETYLKLKEMVLNGVNIFAYYITTYNTKEDYIYNNDEKIDFSIFEKSISNIPTLSSSNGASIAINNLAHPTYF
jgi:hypothetical protein